MNTALAALQLDQPDWQAELDALSDQVSQDFEELTWLRRLAQHFARCDVTRQVRDVAAEVLEPLREVIAAEAIVLLPAETGAPPTPAAADREPLWVGERLCERDICLALVKRLADRGERQTFADNHLDRPAASVSPFARRTYQARPSRDGLDGPSDSLRSLRSCLGVAVTHADHRFGWLLAFNKSSRRACRSFEDRRQFSECEFGSFEAGLLSAAAVMLATHARNVALFREKDALLVGVIQALVNALDARDTYTCGHSNRVARIARCLAGALGLPLCECEHIYVTGLLHDVGKIGVPDRVLLKAGGLSDEEFDLIKAHPEIGHGILEHLEPLSYVLPGVLHHHEEVDGTGYPHGLSGETIPLTARILAVADAFDAMTSTRPYRQEMTVAKAASLLKDGAGTQWDAQVVDAFFAKWDEILVICRETRDVAETRFLRET